MGNFVYHHSGCTSIYLQLSYSIKTPAKGIKLYLSVHGSGLLLRQIPKMTPPMTPIIVPRVRPPLFTHPNSFSLFIIVVVVTLLRPHHVLVFMGLLLFLFAFKLRYLNCKFLPLVLNDKYHIRPHKKFLRVTLLKFIV